MSVCACGRITNGARPACDRCSALAVLGLAQNATQSEVRDAYRALAKVWHPDRFPNDGQLRAKAEERLKEINSAYSSLTTSRVEDRHRQSSAAESTTSPKAESASASQGQTQSSAKTRPPRSANASEFNPSFMKTRRANNSRIAMMVAVLLAGAVWAAVKYGPRAISEFANSINDDSAAHQVANSASDRPQAQTTGSDAGPAAGISQKNATDNSGKAAEKPVVNNHNKSAAADRVSLIVYPSDDPQVAYFTVGSSKNDVVRVQGTPSRVADNLFAYGLSEVYFKDGRVVSWRVDSSSPLKARLPEP